MIWPRAIPSVLLILMSSASLAASDLPKSGMCTHTEGAAGVDLTTQIEWSGQTARITTTWGETLPGKVVGLRKHDEHFKLSIFYEDPITGPLEMSIFGMTMDGEVRHRRAVVGYDTLDDGTQVVSRVQGFEDITCSMLE